MPHTDCSCQTGAGAPPDATDSSTGLSRRSVLRAAAAVGALGGLAGPLTATRMAFGATTGTDTIVVLSLRGGFDGLSAVAPVGEPAYAAARPTIAVPASRAIRLTPTFGLHPALAPLKHWWDAGRLGVVHAVGQPDLSRSHFSAMEAMERAAPGSSVRTGWIDRMTGLTAAGTTFATTAVGSVSAPRAFGGPAREVTMHDADAFSLLNATSATERARLVHAIGALHSGSSSVTAGAVYSALNAVGQIGTVQATRYVPANGAVYPAGALGNALRDVARLIKGQVGLRVAAVDCGDWDMHADMGAVDAGWMQRKLAELAAALNAFALDLGSILSRVTLVTLSEFGRRIAENGSGGLDHGQGNAMLLLGGGVVGGRVFGSWPGVAATQAAGGDLAVRTDYRTVLAELLEKRCGLSTSTVFPGLSSTRLSAFRPRV